MNTQPGCVWTIVWKNGRRETITALSVTFYSNTALIERANVDPMYVSLVYIESISQERDSMSDSLRDTDQPETAREMSVLRSENARLSGAILWALGEVGHFMTQDEFTLAKKISYDARYWWRGELRARAFGHAGRQAYTPTRHLSR